jgi:hypothetical protein
VAVNSTSRYEDADIRSHAAALRLKRIRCVALWPHDNTEYTPFSSESPAAAAAAAVSHCTSSNRHLICHAKCFLKLVFAVVVAARCVALVTGSSSRRRSQRRLSVRPSVRFNYLPLLTLVAMVRVCVCVRARAAASEGRRRRIRKASGRSGRRRNRRIQFQPSSGPTARRETVAQCTEFAVQVIVGSHRRNWRRRRWRRFRSRIFLVIGNFVASAAGVQQGSLQNPARDRRITR